MHIPTVPPLPLRLPAAGRIGSVGRPMTVPPAGPRRRGGARRRILSTPCATLAGLLRPLLRPFLRPLAARSISG